MITFVNVFTVLPEKQADALQKIQQVYVEVFKHQPGFISARLLKSDDGTKVTAIGRYFGYVRELSTSGKNTHKNQKTTDKQRTV